MSAKQRTLISLAGPTANLLLAVLLLEVTNLFFDPLHPVLWAGVAFLGFLQITALLLNLLPIPGLDGYNALEPHLSPETQRALAQFKPYGFLLLFLLLLAPPLNQWFFGSSTASSSCPGCRGCSGGSAPDSRSSGAT